MELGIKYVRFALSHAWNSIGSLAALRLGRAGWADTVAPASASCDGSTNSTMPRLKSRGASSLNIAFRPKELKKRVASHLLEKRPAAPSHALGHRTFRFRGADLQLRGGVPITSRPARTHDYDQNLRMPFPGSRLAKLVAVPHHALRQGETHVVLIAIE
jgi:hypothetical protein